jgi:transcription elongation factor Elf1
MAHSAKTYNVVLECHSCGLRFEIKEIAFDKVTWLPIVSVCPHCGSKSQASGPAVHRIKDLKTQPK